MEEKKQSFRKQLFQIAKTDPQDRDTIPAAKAENAEKVKETQKKTRKAIAPKGRAVMKSNKRPCPTASEIEFAEADILKIVLYYLIEQGEWESINKKMGFEDSSKMQRKYLDLIEDQCNAILQKRSIPLSNNYLFLVESLTIQIAMKEILSHAEVIRKGSFEEQAQKIIRKKEIELLLVDQFLQKTLRACCKTLPSDVAVANVTQFTKDNQLATSLKLSAQKHLLPIKITSESEAEKIAETILKDVLTGKEKNETPLILKKDCEPFPDLAKPSFVFSTHAPNREINMMDQAPPSMMFPQYGMIPPYGYYPNAWPYQPYPMMSQIPPPYAQPFQFVQQNFVFNNPPGSFLNNVGPPTQPFPEGPSLKTTPKQGVSDFTIVTAALKKKKLRTPHP